MLRCLQQVHGLAHAPSGELAPDKHVVSRGAGVLQGTMTALAALSTQPQLAASISIGILLAPVAFTTRMTSPSFVLSSRLGLDTYGMQNGWMEWGSHQPYWGRICG